MSFSSEAKKEIAADLPDKLCCRTAQAYGLLQGGHAFSEKEISLQTELEPVAGLYARLVSRVCGIPRPPLSTLQRRTTLHQCRIQDPQERLTVLDKFGHSPREVSLRLNRANLDCEACARAYLRGAFLSCGAVTDPEHDYHLEFSTPHYNYSRDLVTLLREWDFPAKVTTRGGSYIVYIKESERIEDCLTFLGATMASLELMGVKMVKSIRNDTNRRLNFESANIDKTVQAAGAQRDALQKIENTCGLDALPEELQEVAKLRLEHPEMSLRELGDTLGLSRSGVNHRLKRILQFAEELTKND
ncbi:MAG: DNA-binding protein WhiA [Ruminococcaceae bacterium]|nr:DNA-binding protein WhiA [Oscillospiraceae bacterium]